MTEVLWQPMDTAPKDEPVMLRLRDGLGTYEAGPFVWRDGAWWSDGGRHSHKLAGQLAPLAWKEPG